MHTESIQKTCLASNVAALGAPRGRDVPNTAVLASTKPGVRSQSENRRIQINYPGSGNNSQFTYDGYGHTVEIVETISGSVTSTKQFIWSQNRMREARDGSGILKAQYLSFGQTIGGTTYFYTNDHLGSVREMTSSTGTVVAQYSYDPFGRQAKIQGSQSPDFQYAGYYQHVASGLCLTVNRAYSATLGQWINRDPLDLKDGTNPYGYANANPISLRDPSGLRSLTAPEKDFINKWFPGCFTPEELKRWDLEPTPGRSFSPGTGFILLNPSSSPGEFGHEVFHVLQANESGYFLWEAILQQLASEMHNVPIIDPGGGVSYPPGYNPYAYDKSAPLPPQFQNGNVEAQGQMVQDMIDAANRSGGTIPGQYSDLWNELKKRCKQCKKSK